MHKCRYSEMDYWILGQGPPNFDWDFYSCCSRWMLIRVEFQGKRMGGTCEDSDDQVSQSKRYEFWIESVRTCVKDKPSYL